MKLTCPSCGARLEVSVDPADAGVRPVECAACNALLQWAFRPELEPVQKDEEDSNSIPVDEELLLNEPPSPPVDSLENIQFAEDGEASERDDETLYDEPIPDEVLREAQPIHMVDEEMILSPTPSSEFHIPESRSTSWVKAFVLIAIGFAGGVGWSAFSERSDSSPEAPSMAAKPPAVQQGTSAVASAPMEDARAASVEQKPEPDVRGEGNGSSDIGGVGASVDGNSLSETTNDAEQVTDTAMVSSPDITEPSVDGGQGEPDGVAVLALAQEALDTVEDTKTSADAVSSPVDAADVPSSDAALSKKKENIAKKKTAVKTKKSDGSKSYDGWMKEGNHHYRLGNADNLQKAVVAFQAAAKKTSSVEPLSKLGACFSKLGNHQASFKSFKQAIASNPNYRAAQIGLARAYKRAGKLKEARKAYDDYLSRFPDGNHREEALKALQSIKK